MAVAWSWPAAASVAAPTTDATPAPAAPHAVTAPAAPRSDSSAPTGALGDVVTVRVPPTVIVHLDDAGAIVRIETNTGDDPRPGDDCFVEQHGTYAPAPPQIVARVVHPGSR